MRRWTTSFLVSIGFAAAALTAAAPADANKLDLSLARFVNCADPAHCTPDISSYERFLAEYAFGLAPRTMGPAGTLGYSGFYLGLEGTLTPVPGQGNTNDQRWHLGTKPVDQAPGAMFLPAVRVRKGLPWSFELGSSVSYLAQSELVALGGEIKWSLFEGYRHGFRGALPDVAARGSVVRVLGEADIDMTIIGVDGAISYPFGLGGMISLTPFAGFQYIWTIVRVEPLVYRDREGHDDCGPGSDPSECWATPVDPDGSQPGEMHTNEGGFYDINKLSGPNLERMRLFLGFQLKYEMLSIMLEGAWGLASDWDTAVYPPNEAGATYYPDGDQDPDQAKAKVGHQFQISGGVGIDF